MDEAMKKMLAHLGQTVRAPLGVVLTLDSPLVSSGLIDSLAMVDVLMKLEELSGVAIPPETVQPKDLESVRQMFALVART